MTPLNEEERENTLEEVTHLLDRRKVKTARSKLVELLDPDIADLLSEMDPEQRLMAFNLLPLDDATEVFSFLSTDLQEEIIGNLKGSRLQNLLNEMEPDDRAVMLEELPDEYLEKLLSIIKPEERADTEQILSYPPESVGRILTPNYIAIRPEWSAQQALDYIRENGEDAEIINIIYVTDKEKHLIDFLYLRELILAKPDTIVETLLDGHYVSLKVEEDREQAVLTMGRYDLPALPVIDDNNILIGIVTFDDVADVAEDEVTEDFHKGGAVAPLSISYREASIWALFQKRIGWLFILIFVNLISSGVIAAYEETLAAVISLAFFIPLLIASGGNAGSQSAILLVRAIATEDIKLSQWFKVISKEVLVGLVLGLALGLGSYFLGIFRGGPEIGIIVGLSMLAIIFVSNIIGAILPFALTRVNIDPAVAGSPLVTSIADSVGLLIYFSIATAVLSGSIPIV